MGRLTFGDAIYLMLTGELPRPSISRLVDAMLVSFIDHGATPPSTIAARNAATTGASIRGAVAAGVLGFGRHYGGDILACRQRLDEGLALARHGPLLAAAATEIAERLVQADDIPPPGFGHRYHTVDPRATRLHADRARARNATRLHALHPRARARALAASGACRAPAADQRRRRNRRGLRRPGTVAGNGRRAADGLARAWTGRARPRGAGPRDADARDRPDGASIRRPEPSAGSASGESRRVMAVLPGRARRSVHRFATAAALLLTLERAAASDLSFSPDGTRQVAARTEGAISGVVVDRATGEPVAFALVTLSARAGTATQITDAAGRYAFLGLSADVPYSLSTSRVGYFQSTTGLSRASVGASDIVLASGEWAADIRLALGRIGAISGGVRDDRGRPIVGVQVQVVARRTIAGRSVAAPGPAARTDDRGEFRISGLTQATTSSSPLRPPRSRHRTVLRRGSTRPPTLPPIGRPNAHNM